MDQELRILYEDNHLIAVYKPAGVLVQGDKSGHRTLMDEVKEYIKTRDHKPGNVFLGLLHRLDRPTSGIVLFAKTSKGAARLSEQFREHTIKKSYHALVEGIVSPPIGTLTHYLKKDPIKNKTSVFNEPVSGSKEATLSYRVKSFANEKSLLEIELLTGRSHQIRSQLAFMSHPIVGDIKYGAHEELLDHAIALCATTLLFKLATKDEIKSIQIPAPFKT